MKKTIRILFSIGFLLCALLSGATSIKAETGTKTVVIDVTAGTVLLADFDGTSASNTEALPATMNGMVTISGTTITFNGLDWSTTAPIAVAIINGSSASIDIQGTNSIKSTSNDASATGAVNSLCRVWHSSAVPAGGPVNRACSAGLYSKVDLIISGSGSLASEAGVHGAYSFGIAEFGSSTINSGTITATGAALNAASNAVSSGFYQWPKTDNDDNASLTINGGKVDFSGTVNGSCSYCWGSGITGQFVMAGGDLTASGFGSQSYGATTYGFVNDGFNALRADTMTYAGGHAVFNGGNTAFGTASATNGDDIILPENPGVIYTVSGGAIFRYLVYISSSVNNYGYWINNGTTRSGTIKVGRHTSLTINGEIQANGSNGLYSGGDLYGKSYLEIGPVYTVTYEKNFPASGPTNTASAVTVPSTEILMMGDDSTAFVAPTGTPVNANGSYSFEGWSETSSSTTPEFDVGDKIEDIDANKTLYAIWLAPTVVTYSITYHKNLPASATDNITALPTDQTVNSGAASAALGSPTGAPSNAIGSYTFLGWSETASDTSATYSSTDTISNVSANMDLYAIWQAPTVVTYTITYHKNLPSSSTDNISALPTDQTVNSGAASAALGSPTGAPSNAVGSYTFLGWSQNALATTATYSSTDTINNVTSDIDLYAIWSAPVPNTYSIIYNDNKPSGASGSVTLPSNQTGITSGTASSVLGGPTGTFTNSDGSYIFLGWSENSSDTTATYSSSGTVAAVTADMTLYAIWQAPAPLGPVVTITYNANIPSGAINNTAMPATQTLHSGDQSDPLGAPIGRPVNSDGEEYEFTGWATSASGSPVYGSAGTINPITSDVVLYATWKAPANKYTISFDKNLPSGTIDNVAVPVSQIVKEGNDSSALGQPSGAPQETGKTYVFDGWATSASGPVVYGPSAAIQNVTANITLYAIWSESAPATTATITFDKNIPSGATDGVTSVPAAQTVAIGAPFALQSTMVPAGAPYNSNGSYTFAGWGTSPTGAVTFKATAFNSGSGVIKSASEHVILGAIYGLTDTIPAVNGNITLYAIWTAPATTASPTPATPAAPYNPPVVPTSYNMELTGWTALFGAGALIFAFANKKVQRLAKKKENRD